MAQRSPAFVRRINNSEQNKRKRGNRSRSDALDGASADELHHRARDSANVKCLDLTPIAFRSAIFPQRDSCGNLISVNSRVAVSADLTDSIETMIANR